MAVTVLPQGTEVTVNPGPIETQIQVPKIGLGVVNVGPTPVTLTAVYPPQATKFVLNPGAAVPWPSVGTLYAFVTGTTTGQLFCIPGASTYGGQLGIQSTGLSGASGSGIRTAIIPVISNTAYGLKPADIPAMFTIWNLGFILNSFSQQVTEGRIDFIFGDNATPNCIIDAVSWQEGASNRLAAANIGLVLVGSGYHATILNHMDQEVSAFICYSEL